jgi:hypothetical protein
MRYFLNRLGCEFKKPKLVPGNPDREAQEIFVEQYEKSMESEGQNVEVVFLDAMHPEPNTVAAYGWIKIRGAAAPADQQRAAAADSPRRDKRPPLL